LQVGAQRRILLGRDLHALGGGTEADGGEQIGVLPARRLECARELDELVKIVDG
jgi:hypothetical protein